MEAFLINAPKRRKSKGRKTTMAYRTKRRARRGRRAYSSARPVRRRRASRRYRRNPGMAELMLMNPRRKRSRRGRRGSLRSRVKRYAGRAKGLLGRLKGGLSGITNTMQEAAFIAGGAIAVSQIQARLVPEAWKEGAMKHVSRAGVAILGGMLLHRVSPRIARAFTLGGLVSTIQLAANEYLGAAIAPLGGLEESSLGAYYAEAPALSAYVAPGETVDAQPDFMGGMSWESDTPSRLDPSERL